MKKPEHISSKQTQEGNRALWDELTPVHVKSYGVDRFLAGDPWLPKQIVKEVGDVNGASLLHLQCHFGLDTLAWARRGANVTGVDFSPKAIAAARELSEKAEIPAQFVLSDIYDLPKYLEGAFDIVFTSIGVLCWLRDLKAWARIITHYLKPGGFFYIMDGHPLLYTFDDEGHWTFEIPYFHQAAPYVWDGPDPDYMDKSYIIQNPSYEWQWTVSDIINAILGAGLHLVFFNEFGVMEDPVFPEMVRRPDGLYSFPDMPVELPVLFSLKARKPE